MIEGASYALAVHPDPKLDAYVDSLIAKIAAAQEKDGYLYTTRTINPAKPHPWAGTERWQLEKVDSHELYDLGHLFEAATAHYLATGKRSFLDVGVSAADLLVATFGPGQAGDLARARDHRDGPRAACTASPATSQYLESRQVPDRRARARRAADEQSSADLQPVRRCRSSSRPRRSATPCAPTYCTRAWPTSPRSPATPRTSKPSTPSGTTSSARSSTSRAASARRGSGEAFGGPYELPNMTAYNETCAAVGNDFWNERLFLLHADAKYIDVHRAHALQRPDLRRLARRQDVLLSESARVEGPARASGLVRRRVLPGQHHALHGVGARATSTRSRDRRSSSTSSRPGTADITLDDGKKVTLTQETRYPWDGAVKLTVAPADARPVRRSTCGFPAGRANEPVPGDLYRYLDTARPAADAHRQRPGRARSSSTRATSRSPAPGRPATSIELNAADAGPPRGRQRSRARPIAIASRFSAGRSCTPPSGRTTRTDTCATSCCPTTRRSRRSFARRLLNGVAVVQRHVEVAVARCRRQGRLEDAAVHGDSVLRVGESRARRDDGLDAADRCESPRRVHGRRWR